MDWFTDMVDVWGLSKLFSGYCNFSNFLSRAMESLVMEKKGLTVHTCFGGYIYTRWGSGDTRVEVSVLHLLLGHLTMSQQQWQAALPSISKIQDRITGKPCFILLLFDLLHKLLTPHSSSNKIKQEKNVSATIQARETFVFIMN